MKLLFIKAITLYLLLNPTNSSIIRENSYENDIEIWQNNLNAEFKNREHSPLTQKSFESFEKLDFYKIDKKFRVEARLTFTPFSPVFKMKTTTSRLPEYKKFGTAEFEFEGKTYSLSVYQNQELLHREGYEDYLFIPYTDLTSGNTSYGGGKYIDLRIPKDDTLIIDFNKSYNPYCAYNHKYSCPIPPRENNLNLRIEAGVMVFKGEY